MAEKKRRTWLWVIGWLFCFPVPVTILMLRSRKLPSPVRYGAIAAAWILAFALGSTGISTSKDGVESSNPTPQELLAEGSAEGVAEPNNEGAAEETSEAQPIIYPGDEGVNSFVVAFNAAHPEMPIEAEDLAVYHHHGQDHEDQVWTHLGTDRVLLTGRSVYYESYSENQTVQEYGDANHRVFALVVPILHPELSAEEVERRWQEAINAPTYPVQWDDGMSFEAGPPSDEGSPGSFAYFKVY